MKNEATMNEELTKAWMAGFVDGEGCITISRQIRKNRPSPAYRAFITVSNTNRECLSPFLNGYGGEIYAAHETRRDARKVRWADAYTWHCPASNSAPFLRDILPYLRVKRGQAETVIDFCENKARACMDRQPTGRRGGSEHLTPDELARREEWRKRVQLLNSKGPRARRELAGVK